MKNTIKFLGLIALVAIIGFSMAACDDAGDDADDLLTSTPPSIVGTWSAFEDGFIVSYTFNSNGTGELVFGDSLSMTWSISGTSLTITFNDAPLTYIYTVNISGNSLTMTRTSPTPLEPFTLTKQTTSIVGTWSIVEDGFIISYTFNSNGTGEWVVLGDSLSMTWFISETSLTITFNGTPYIYIYTFNINGNSLTMTRTSPTPQEPLTLTKQETPQIVGTWSGFLDENVLFPISFTFNSNGTGVYYLGEPFSMMWLISGTSLTTHSFVYTTTLAYTFTFDISGNSLTMTRTLPTPDEPLTLTKQ